ncbi:MAG TPA: RIP metalloprotease RseP [Thermohalobaculum sp.]|nr:RIP metalloprotease RseP [Thermohalobaculum sp.]
MQLLAEIPFVGTVLTVVVPFLIVLGIVVFVHEFGHYIVGRLCGIKAEVFSIGFGKRLWGWTDRRGTHWQVAALPLGGYVRFVGDMDPASAGKGDDAKLSPEDRRAAFHNASLWRRTLTVAAGPLANFLLSVAIFAGILLWAGQGAKEPVIGAVNQEAAAEVGFAAGDRVLAIDGQPVETFVEIINILGKTSGEPTPVTVERDDQVMQITVRYRRAPLIVEVVPGMPAARAGLMPGDVILTIDGTPIGSYRDLQVVLADKPAGAPVELTVERDGRQRTFAVLPEMVDREHPVSGEIAKVPTLGVRGAALAGVEPLREPMPVHDALIGGVNETWRIISGTMIYVGDMLFQGADTSQLGGPIRIAEVSGDAAQQGFSSFVWLIAVLSTSIGLINLFPIPILDGGHLMFYVIEFLRGRPVGEAWMRVGTMIGLSLVILLMVFATYNDLLRL